MDIYVMERKLVIAVEPPRPQDRPLIAHWAVYDLDNKKLSWGYSAGMEKSGAGCIPMAMKNAKASARKLLKNVQS